MGEKNHKVTSFFTDTENLYIFRIGLEREVQLLQHKNLEGLSGQYLVDSQRAVHIQFIVFKILAVYIENCYVTIKH